MTSSLRPYSYLVPHSAVNFSYFSHNKIHFYFIQFPEGIHVIRNTLWGQHTQPTPESSNTKSEVRRYDIRTHILPSNEAHSDN
jgi:hypothetical protein